MASKSINNRYFALAFAFTFLVLSVLAMVAGFLAAPRKSNNTSYPSGENGAIYLPKETERFSALVVLENVVDAPVYVVFQIDPVKGKIPVAALPGNVTLAIEGSKTTLNSLYQTRGASGCAEALGSLLHTTISKHARLTANGFVAVADQLGPVEAQLEEEISYQHSGGNQVHYAQGLQSLTGKELVWVFGYSGYTEGTAAQYNQIAYLCSQLIGQHLSKFTGERGEEIFQSMVNQMDSNFTVAGYRAKAASLDFMASLLVKPATMVPISGFYEEGEYCLYDSAWFLLQHTFGDNKVETVE